MLVISLFISGSSVVFAFSLSVCRLCEFCICLESTSSKSPFGVVSLAWDSKISKETCCATLAPLRLFWEVESVLCAASLSKILGVAVGLVGLSKDFGAELDWRSAVVPKS